MSREIITEIKVRFGECDYYQHVNNAVYMIYLDTGLVEFFRSTGESPKNLPYLFHLVHASIDFKAGATFDDMLIVKTKLENIGNTSITFNQTITNKVTGELIVEAKKIGVFLSTETNSKCEVPEIIKIMYKE